MAWFWILKALARRELTVGLLPLGGANAMVLDSVGIGAKRVGNWAAVDRWRQRHDFGFCRHRREES